MIESLHQFLNRINQLQSFWEDAESIDALVGTSNLIEGKTSENPDIWSHIARLQSSKINRKVQTYVTGIILLYGLFEQFVEEVMIAYLEELESTIENFADIPEKIRISHTNLSAQLLINRDLDKYRDRCNELEIIQRMQSCIDEGPFKLNVLAFTDHKSNFRIASINQFFETAGISGMAKQLRIAPTFETYSQRKFQNQHIAGLPDKVVFADLDDLAWRRNIVAHGWPDDTLSVEMMKERTDFIRIIGQCIYEVLRQNALAIIVKHRCDNLPKPLSVFNSSIVCFHLESGTVSKGSRIIARKPNGSYLEGKILQIQVNHDNLAEVIAPPVIDVAFNLDFKAKLNYDYFIIKQVYMNGSFQKSGINSFEK